jgi:hypothetical protein
LINTQHVAALALFRLIGGGTEFRVHSRGIDLVMPPDCPAALPDEAAPHAVVIGALLRLRAADEPRRVSPHQGRG